MQPYAWWRTLATAVALLAAILPFAARALVGAPGARVHVRWQPSIEPANREALEARYHLADGEALDAATWRYDLIETSADNIRRLVDDPAVADTHDIDRSNYVVDPSAVRTARRQRVAAGGDALVLTADGLALMLAAAAALLIAVGIAGLAPTPRAIPPLLSQTWRRCSNAVRDAARPVARFLQRGIPEVDAATAGIFRIVFGVSVLVFIVLHRFGASRLDYSWDVKIVGDLHLFVLEWLRGRPYIVDLLTPWLLATGVAFTAGVFTRLTYTLFVAGMIVWAFVATYTGGLHPYATLALTLVALLPSRWADACSVDAWLTRRRGRSRAAAPGKQYGYSVWVPGLVVGVAFAAAAWAKLSGPSWTSWVVNGTIKYHFVTDAAHAPVDWGLQFLNYPRLAILVSLAAVATESLVVTAAFVRNELYRLGLGMAALAMLTGFWLFMGVIWAGWWILLLGFLPWRRLSRLSPGIAQAPVRGGLEVSPPLALHLALIVMIIAQQAMSTLVVESAPMFTHYPMYSGTWASLDEFNASRPPVYRIVAETDRGRLVLDCDPAERFVAELQEALGGSADAASSVWRQLRGCGEDLSDVRHVVFEGYRERFDRERLEFTLTRMGNTLGPLALHTGARSSHRP